MSEKMNVNDFSKRTTEVRYPFLKILTPNATVPLIVSVLEEGEVPLLLTLNGVSKVIKRISKSAYNIDKMLRTCGSLEYHRGEGDVVLINDIVDYLEVFTWTC